MKTIPLAICLFTSTKGHFGRTDRYLQTLDALNSRIPLDQFAGRFATMKVSEENGVANTINRELKRRDFAVREAYADWSHGDQSHQTEYLSDLHGVYNTPMVLSHQYSLHLEDDFILHAYDGDLLRQFAIAIRILEQSPEVMQVRFPRFANEADRIRGLRAKHGINGLVHDVRDDHFRCNDFSLNPSIFRTRDLKIASHLFKVNGANLPQHVEHGFGRLVHALSRSETPFAVLNPANVKAAHIGTRPGEEDSVTEPLNAN